MSRGDDAILGVFHRAAHAVELRPVVRRRPSTVLPGTYYWECSHPDDGLPHPATGPLPADAWRRWVALRMDQCRREQGPMHGRLA